MSRAITKTPTDSQNMPAVGFNSLRLSESQLDLLKRTYAKGTTDDEFALFLAVADRTGLDPFARQIYCIKRRVRDGNEWKEVAQTQVGIDGFRLIAERSHNYAGQLGPYWCGPDGQWVDVWLQPEAPAAARVGVLRKDWKQPVWGVAKYDSFVQTVADNKGNRVPNHMWATMPDNQLAKCAEAQALRKAFPQELSALEVRIDEAVDGEYREVMEEVGRAALLEGHALTKEEAKSPEARAAWVDEMTQQQAGTSNPGSDNPIFHEGRGTHPEIDADGVIHETGEATGAGPSGDDGKHHQRGSDSARGEASGAVDVTSQPGELTPPSGEAGVSQGAAAPASPLETATAEERDGYLRLLDLATKFAIDTAGYALDFDTAEQAQVQMLGRRLKREIEAKWV